MGVGAVDLKRSGPGRHINKAQEILELLAHDPLAIATSPLAEFPDDALIDHWQNLRRDAFFFKQYKTKNVQDLIDLLCVRKMYKSISSSLALTS